MSYDPPHPKDTIVRDGILYGKPRTDKKFGLQANVNARHARDWKQDEMDAAGVRVFYSVYKDDFPLTRHYPDRYGLMIWSPLRAAKPGETGVWHDVYGKPLR